MKNKYLFKGIVTEKDGFLRGPFGGDLKKEIFVQKDSDTYKVYEQGVVLNSDKSIGSYYISKKDYDDGLNKFSVKDKDFLVSCSGMNMGAIYQLKIPFEPGIINQALLRIRLNNQLIDDDYFYYLFKEFISRKITRGTGDSTIPNFPPLEYIKKIEIELPNIPTQEKIGKFLSILDLKIYLNNKINTELESIAKTLYNYWFVQFDFPDEEGKPYKTSGGEMEYNEILKRQIPKGWDGLLLKDWLEFERGIEPLSANYFNIKESEEHIPFYKVGDMDGETSTWILKKNADSSVAIEEDILVSFDGTVGKIAIGLNGAFSTGIRKIYQKKGYFPKSYIYFIFKSEEIQKIMKKKANPGSNIIHASSSIAFLSVPYNEKIVRLYNERTESIFNKLLQNKKQTHELIQLRDFLIPLLLNGQVKVN